MEDLIDAIRTRIVASASLWIDTPFAHQQRVRQVGVDCAGLVVAVGQSIGFKIHDHPRRDYSRYPVVGRTLEAMCNEQLDRVKAAQPGSVYLFWVRKKGAPQHLGIATRPGYMIHAWADPGKTLQSPLGKYWKERVHAIYDFRFGQVM